MGFLGKAGLMKRVEICFDDEVYGVLEARAASGSCSLAELVGRMVGENLREDLEDLRVFEKREGEDVEDFEVMVEGVGHRRDVYEG